MSYKRAICEDSEDQLCASVNSEDFKTQEDMYNSCDEKLLEKKEQYYSTRTHSRRKN